MKHIPLTTNGKRDCRRLREYAEGLSQTEFQALTALPQEKCAPFSNTELAIQKIWAQIFQVDTSAIGSNDHFFRLGGDSLSAMKHARLSREHGLYISVSNIFKNPKLSDLASSISYTTNYTGLGDVTAGSIPRFSLLGDNLDLAATLQDAADQCHIRPDQIDDLYPCAPLQEGLMALTNKSPGSYTAECKMIYINLFWPRS